VQPISDVRASAEYRRAMTSVVLERALTRAAGRALADADADAGSQRSLADTRRNS
jgi:xanthine dehydrogenase iron-sulfur cluster and FAD-binding subunit A